MVSALFFDRIEVVLRREQVILKLSKSLQLAPRLLRQGTLGFPQNFLRSRRERLALNVIETAQDIKRRNGCEGIEKSRRQTRDHVQVRGGRLDKCEQG